MVTISTECVTYPLPHLLRLHRLVHQGVLPHAEQHQVRLVARRERRDEILLAQRADQNRIRDDQRRFLLRDGRHILPADAQARLPAEDVRIEAQVVL